MSQRERVTIAINSDSIAQVAHMRIFIATYLQLQLTGMVPVSS